MEAWPSPLSSRAQPRDLQFRGPFLEMSFDGAKPRACPKAFSLLVLTERPNPTRLFLKKSRTSLPCPVQSRSENALSEVEWGSAVRSTDHRCTGKAPPSLCHPERSRGICSSLHRPSKPRESTNRSFVIPTGAQRSGGTCCSLHQPPDVQMKAPPFPLSSRAKPRDLQFCRLVLEMFSRGSGLALRPGEPALSLSKGPTAKRQPCPEGLGPRRTMIPSAVGAALSLSATQPDFAISGRSTSLSNEINATESTNQLIWTALKFRSPHRG